MATYDRHVAWRDDEGTSDSGYRSNDANGNQIKQQREQRRRQKRRKKIIWYARIAGILIAIVGLAVGSVIIGIKDVKMAVELHNMKRAAADNMAFDDGYEDILSVPMINLDDGSIQNDMVRSGEAEALGELGGGVPDDMQDLSDTGLSGDTSEIIGCPPNVDDGNAEFAPVMSDSVRGFADEVISTNGILIDLSNDTIVASKDCKSRIVPASMTKILTLLVAAEHITDLNDTVSISPDITYYAYKHDCSSAGFANDETVTIKDLMYGTILPSGADAAMSLAEYVAGSQEAFVDMMNEKVAQLGLSETSHFTNCIGIYDEQLYSTCYDMAVILHAALSNEMCREVLHAHKYTTSNTTEHPEGIVLSNWFLRRIEDKYCGGEVMYAKTGYVAESGFCAASFAQDDLGNSFICVTACSTSNWRCIYDHVALYKTVFPKADIDPTAAQ